jgi:hypothetical protein
LEPDILRILSILGRPLTNQIEYSQRLIETGDEYLRVAGMAALLEFSLWPPALWEQAVQASKHGLVASKAFKFFVDNYEYELAERVAAVVEASEKPETAERMRAAIRLDAPRLVDMHARQFLHDGRTEHLIGAADQAEKAQGWRASVIWLARATALQPIRVDEAYRLLRVLETANQFDAIEEILGIFARGRVFGEMQAIFGGLLKLRKKDFKGAMQAVSKLRLAEMRGGAARLCQINAEAHEGLGQYRDAYKWYRLLNKQGMQPGLDKREFMAATERLSGISYPTLSEDKRADTVMMTGFPRSGTTLLEHALSAHPSVETFEEIPSVTSMALAVDRALDAGIKGESERREAFERARARYYVELDRRRAKPGATVLLDKLPLRSAWIEILEHFFPKQRYIFSIRHPYDVVLSCFKQHFTPNIAMENFRTLDDACELYDRVMTLWFGVFPGESDRVLYVRYDELVTNFEEQVKRTLAFLGLPWSDEVLHFANLSESRQVATPSYAKVRAGLGLGVQTSWRNYRFAFDNSHGAKLHKWIDRFGYER